VIGLHLAVQRLRGQKPMHASPEARRSIEEVETH
jgi:hypothetical protein